MRYLRERWASQVPRAAKPPTRMIARMTRNIAKTHAMPIPSAAHLNHHWPGVVIKLMKKSMTRMKGAVNKNLIERAVFNIREVPPR